MKKIIITLILITCITGCMDESSATTAVYQTITSKEVMESIDDNTYKIIDVRTIGEYSEGHIKGSINIPVDNINNIEDYIKDKNTKIVVYCRSGARSKTASEALLKLGYNYIYDMGGLQNYEYDLVKD